MNFYIKNNIYFEIIKKVQSLITLICTEYGKRLAQYYIYSQKELTDEMPGSYDKLASAGNALCSFATCIVGDTAGLLR